MEQFPSIEKLDTGILYALELASSISMMLLAFGLIASMANVLTKGSVLTSNLIMQRIRAWTQCFGIDAGLSGTIILNSWKTCACYFPNQPSPKRRTQNPLLLAEGEQGTNNGERVRAYLLLHPEAKVREVAEALSISVSTANKWMSRVKG